MTYHASHLPRRALLPMALSLALVPLAAGAQEQTQTGDDEAATTLDRIEVTGSRIRRAEVETAAPVLSLSRQDIEATGLTSVGDLLFNITASDSGALRNITTSTNAGDGTQNVSLRGLGANRSLVLVNGRRWVTDSSGSGSTDLNTIPVAIVERIEVLKDGASAIYGSDAIGGVINVITRKNFEGGEARVYLGQYTQGDGFQEAYDFTLGASNDRVNAVLNLAYTDQEAVMASDRATSRVPLYGASNFPNAGLLGSPSTPYGNFTICDSPLTPNPAGFRTCTPLPNGTGGASGSATAFTLIPGRPGTSPSDYRDLRFFTFDGSGDTDLYNYAPVNTLLQPIERFSLYGQASLALTDRINANFQATYIKRRASSDQAEVPLSMDIRGNAGPQWTFAPTADNVFNPFGADMRQVNFRMSALGPRRGQFDFDNLAVTTWLDGSFEFLDRPMYWDAGYSYLDSSFNVTAPNYVNLANLRNAVGPSFRDGAGVLRCGTPGNIIQGCVPFNVFGGPDLGVAARVITPEEQRAMLNYVGYTQVQKLGTTTKDYFINLTGDVVDLPAGTMGFAVGVEHRRTGFFDQPDPLVAGGISSTNFSEPTNGFVNSTEAYAELNVPILANVPFAKLLEANVAVRRSEYDSRGRFGSTIVEPDIGNNTSRKLGLKWQVFDDLLLRATFSESFRAPSVAELYAGGGEGFPNAQDPCNNGAGGYVTLTAADQARCQAGGVPGGGVLQPSPQIRSLAGGNPQLKPEFGDTRTIGVVYSPRFAPGLDLTLDYYNIRLKDVIAARTTATIMNICHRTDPTVTEADRALYCSFIQRDATGSIVVVRQTSFNLGEGEVEGYDFTASYRSPEWSWGQLLVQWDNTYQTENTLFGTVGEYNGAPTFRLRSNLTTSWKLGAFDVSWAARYMSDLDEDCSGYYGLFEAGATSGQLCSEAADAVFDETGALLKVDNHAGSRVYHDLQVGMKTSWNGRFVIGKRNVFDKDPPRLNSPFAHSFDAAYDLPEGGFYYMQYTQKF